MAKLTVNVALAKLGNPDFSFTKKELDAWEVVRFDVGLGGSTVALKVAPIAQCHHVTDCTIDVPIGVKYMVASELRDNVTNAQTTAERNDHRQLLMRVESHATSHYTRVAKPVIPTWETDIKRDLNKTLPSNFAPTTEDEAGIQKRLAPLVAYWVEELGYRIDQDVNQWEKADYPQLEKFLQGLRGIAVFIPNGFPIPKFLRKPTARPKITFPACRAKAVK